MRVLVVEDEPKIREVLTAYLCKEGWEVDYTSDGNEAVRMFDEEKYDVVLLDLMLEGMHGEEVCREIRSKSMVPILMLTSKSREIDTIQGLQLGADDYIVKPYRVKEVVARIHAIMRRTRAQNPPTTKKTVQTFDRGRLVLDLEASTLMVRGAFVNLTTTEFKLMTVLASRPGKIFSRSDLSYQVLGYRFQGDSRSIDTHLKNLRKKIEEDNKAPKYIITMVGSGYKLAAGSDDGEEE